MKARLLFLTTAFVATAAFAQQQPQSAQSSDPFIQLDADQSGGISAEEAQKSPVVAQAFATADRNSDGILGREEFDAAFEVAKPQQSETPAPQMPAPQSEPSQPPQ